MNVKTLKNHFSAELSGIYPSEEIQSFFSILSEKYLCMSRLELAINSEMVLSEVVSEKYKEAILRLKKHEPVQYIIGETEFFGLRFNVNKHTLIPRPETEELVDWILAETNTQNPKPRTILDIGTGSGCIAISLAKNLPGSSVSAIDISEEILLIAKQNALINEAEVNFERLDILQTRTLSKVYDVIVSNPPYVRNSEKNKMQPNVLEYEPDTALFVSDQDPLLFYRKIARLAKQYLTTNGSMYFEINEYLGEDMLLMLKDTGFETVQIKKDFFGKDRMIKCTNNE
jgi:release factor glutamine methyltransferase